MGVYAQNDPALVAQLIEKLGFDADATVTLDNESEKLSNALRHHREITVLTRPLLEKWADLAESATLKALIADKKALNEWMRGRDVLDLVEDDDTAVIGEGSRQQAQCGVPTGQLETTEELSSRQLRGGDLLREQAQLVSYRSP